MEEKFASERTDKAIRFVCGFLVLGILSWLFIGTRFLSVSAQITAELGA